MTNTIKDYAFNNMTSIGYDNCDQTQKNIQNNNYSNMTLTNYNKDDCYMTKTIDFAVNTPGLNYSGTHQTGIGGCQIDENSKLKLDKELRPPCKINLIERPYLTVPYLGKGTVDAVIESKLQQGEQLSSKKTSFNMPEKSYLNYLYTPMIPKLEKEVKNPSNKIESMASSSWVRGGIPSRELTKNQEYFNNCN